MIRVDLPLPETPVTQTNAPSGISAETEARLLALAPSIRMQRSARIGRRSAGTSIMRSPRRYFAVRLFLDRSTASGVPDATTSPPCTPAPGPRSIR